MRKELDDKLCADYPKLFKHRHGDKRETAMCWGFSCGDGWYELINRLCHTIQSHIDQQIDSRNWALTHNARIEAALAGNLQPLRDTYKIFTGSTHSPAETVEQYEKRIAMYANDPIREVPAEPEQVVAVQVKEKFGGLRFYVDYSDDFVHGAIRFAESMSYVICDVCGGPGKVGNQDCNYGLSVEEQRKVPGYYATRCEAHWGRQTDPDESAFLGRASYK